MIIDGIDTGRVFQAEEIVALHRLGKLRPIALKGYVARADADGTCRFVHWTERFANRMTPDSPGGARLRTFGTNVDMVEELRRDLPPVRKRTPQERVKSLARKIAPDRTLLPEDIVQEVVRRRWQMGDPVTGEDVQAVAARFLQNAEKEQEKYDDKHVVRNFVKGPR